MTDTKSKERQYLTLFVYTDEAEITPEARDLMMQAGYLPVRVKNLDAYRLVEKSVRLPREQLDQIGQAALWAVQGGGTYDGAKERFVNKLGELLGTWTFKK